MSARRDGERGLSLLEAIIIATVTALLALILLPLLPRTSAGALQLAERGVETLDTVRAEREFRSLIRALSVRGTLEAPIAVLEGDAASALLRPNLQAPIACASAGAPTVRLTITPNALVCVSDRGQRSVLRWRGAGNASLAYSSDGATWRTSWAESASAPFVRFELRQNGRVIASWIEHAAGGEP